MGRSLRAGIPGSQPFAQYLGADGDQWRRRSHGPCSCRPLPIARADRRGCEWSRLRRRRREVAATSGSQGVAPRARGGRRIPPPVPRRGAGGGVAQSPQRDGGLRLGRGSCAVHGARAALGRQSAQLARLGGAPHYVAGGAPGRPSDRGARVCARAWRRAPRHQACQPAVRRARDPARRRLRLGARACWRRVGPNLRER